eukprot:8629382-Pyramimonas_sp.AAC.1
MCISCRRRGRLGASKRIESAFDRAPNLAMSRSTHEDTSLLIMPCIGFQTQSRDEKRFSTAT